PMVPLRASTTKSESLPDDPTAFVPSRPWNLPSITTWDDSRNQNHPTDSAEEAEIVHQQCAVLAQHPGDLFHGLDAGAHGLRAPEVQEHAGPIGRVVFPELLEVFFEQIGADGL